MKNNNDAKKEWDDYTSRELAEVTPVLNRLGFYLESEQPHLGGERYLMQAVTTAHGRKLILIGHRSKDGEKVVIKATSEPAGIREIEHERRYREALRRIRFAYQIFFSPREISFTKHNGFVISVQEFLESARSFLSRPTKEQFLLALKAFKAQESAHATTYRHRRFIEKTFGNKEVQDYLRAFSAFKTDISNALPEKKELRELLESAEHFLRDNAEIIEQYSGFLTHTDFVPHNFRVIGEDIYLLDHSSIRFGNKYEGWARFINFMALHNPELAQILVEYVKDNRTPEETLSLKLMRLYRLGEIIFYYTNTLSKSSGDLLILNQARVAFWTRVLEAVLYDKPVPQDIVEKYRRTRDSLRSKEEKLRQVKLH